MKLTQKQIGFVLDVVKEVKPGQAYMNHYKVKSMAVADAAASRLLKTVKIQAYHKELLEKMEDETIASAKERRQRLTKFLREDNYSKFGINRQSNIQAIAELNKMEKIYTENITIDNRTLNINVGDPKEKLISLLSRLALRTGEAEGDTGTKPEGS